MDISRWRKPPVKRHRKNPPRQGQRIASQVAWIKIDATLLQEFQILFLESPRPMMLLLSGDVAAHDLTLRGANGEGPVTLLPGERWQANLLMHLTRRDAFYFTQDVREAMRGGQSGENVDMVFYSSHDFRNDLQ